MKVNSIMVFLLALCGFLFSATVLVTDSQDNPLPGIKVSQYSSLNALLLDTKTTNELGRASFTLSDQRSYFKIQGVFVKNPDKKEAKSYFTDRDNQVCAVYEDGVYSCSLDEIHLYAIKIDEAKFSKRLVKKSSDGSWNLLGIKSLSEGVKLFNEKFKGRARNFATFKSD